MPWRNRPTHIDNMTSNISHVVFIDENGDSSMENIIKSERNGKEPDRSNQFFTITACLFQRSDYAKARDKISAIKQKHWKDGLFDYKGKVKRICFHSSDIRTRKNAFHPTVINFSDFMDDLNKLMTDIKAVIFSSSIDKLTLYRRYSNPHNPYDLCMCFVLERIVLSLSNNDKCIIILEARGKKEDKALLEYLKSLIDNGSYYVSKDYFKKIKGVYFNPKWSKSDNDLKSFCGLEIADLISYPIYKYYVYKVRDRAYEIIEPKIYGYPVINGRGLKFFP